MLNILLAGFIHEEFRYQHKTLDTSIVTYLFNTPFIQQKTPGRTCEFDPVHILVNKYEKCMIYDNTL